ncbi:MAG: cyclic nucleotide-binding domain-containing protein [Desulfocapsaceae bacterium]
MVSHADVRDIVILGHLTEEMIRKLLPEIEVLRFEEGEIIFRRGDPADMFYMLKRGKILLEQRISDKVTISMGTVKPGFSFGWSAMLEDEKFSLDTICGEPCEVLRIRSRTLLDMIEDDHSMGYRFMRRLLYVVRKRLDGRTELFLKLIMNHPDIHPLVKE